MAQRGRRTPVIWKSGGVSPGTWNDPGNWTCSGGSWAGDSANDTAILDAGEGVNVTTPSAALSLFDLIITDAIATVVIAPDATLLAAKVTVAGVLDAGSLVASVSISGDLTIGTFIAAAGLATVSGAFVVADAMSHNSGTVNLTGSGNFGSAGQGFSVLNVQFGPYLLIQDTAVQQLGATGAV